MLARHFVEKYSKKMNKNIIKLSSYALDFLRHYDFPGNVRELENLIERSVAFSSTNIILPESLTLSLNNKRRWIEGVGDQRFDTEDVEQGVDLDEILSQIENAYLNKAMELTGRNKNKAADLLGLSQRSMRYRISKLEEDLSS